MYPPLFALNHCLPSTVCPQLQLKERLLLDQDEAVRRKERELEAALDESTRRTHLLEGELDGMGSTVATVRGASAGDRLRLHAGEGLYR